MILLNNSEMTVEELLLVVGGAAPPAKTDQSVNLVDGNLQLAMILAQTFYDLNNGTPPPPLKKVIWGSP